MVRLQTLMYDFKSVVAADATSDLHVADVPRRTDVTPTQFEALKSLYGHATSEAAGQKCGEFAEDHAAGGHYEHTKVVREYMAAL